MNIEQLLNNAKTAVKQLNEMNEKFQEIDKLHRIFVGKRTFKPTNGEAVGARVSNPSPLDSLVSVATASSTHRAVMSSQTEARKKVVSDRRKGSNTYSRDQLHKHVKAILKLFLNNGKFERDLYWISIPNGEFSLTSDMNKRKDIWKTILEKINEPENVSVIISGEFKSAWNNYVRPIIYVPNRKFSTIKKFR